MTLPISLEAGGPASRFPANPPTRQPAKPERRDCVFPQSWPRGFADVRHGAWRLRPQLHSARDQHVIAAFSLKRSHHG